MLDFRDPSLQRNCTMGNDTEGGADAVAIRLAYTEYTGGDCRIEKMYSGRAHDLKKESSARLNMVGNPARRFDFRRHLLWTGIIKSSLP